MWRIALVALVVVVALAGPARGAPPVVVGGNVNALARAGNTLYVGGSFITVGPYVGAGALLDPHSGAVTGRGPTFGGATASVAAVVGDGRGGWYVGGRFTRAGRTARRDLVHVLPGGRVDPRFRPDPDGLVRTLALRGGRLWVGGDFRRVGGRRHLAVAELSAATGRARAWDAGLRVSRTELPSVSALALAGRRLYVGGSFFRARRAQRGGIAVFDLSSGRLGRWNPDVSGLVAAIVPAGRAVYLGGDWSTDHGSRSEALRAFDVRTARATAWRPPVDSDNDQATPRVDALLVERSSVIVGGYFVQAGGARREGLAELDRNTGRATPWDPNPQRGFVSTLAREGGRLYAGGNFARIGGADRPWLAALSLATGRAEAFAPRPNRRVLALALQHGRLFAGGDFSSAPTEPRRRLAALDARTGRILPWSPDVEGGDVYALATDGKTVYAGGDFRRVGGMERVALVAVGAGSGAVRPWDAGVREPGTYDSALVDALALAPGGPLYAGGLFTRAGGAARASLAALDPTTARATAWAPGVTPADDVGTTVGVGAVQALLLDGSRVLVGGSFTKIGGRTRSDLAAVNAVTGRAEPWAPQPDDQVLALARGPARKLFVGGAFTHLGARRATRLGAVDLRTGAPLAFRADVRADDPNTDPSADIDALRYRRGVLYAGGRFRSGGGRRGLAAFTPGGRLRSSFRPRVSFQVLALDSDASRLFVGGRFARAGGQDRIGVAALTPSTGIGAWPPFPATLGR